MNEMQPKQKAIEKLVKLSDSKGYISFEDILDTIELFGLPMEEVDRISGYLLTYGCIIREANIQEIEYDDEEINDRSKLNYDDIFSKVLEIDGSLEEYINELKAIPPPGYKEVESLIYQAKEGNIYARTRIISMYLKVVVRIALWASEKYRTPIADAIQNGNLGLIIALEKYDPDGEHKFSTYAPWWIRQNISRETSSINALIYFPAHMKEILFNLYDLVFEHDCNECSGHSVCKNLISDVMEKLNVDYETAKKYIEYLYPLYSVEEICENVNEESFCDNGLKEYEMVETVDFEMCKITTNKILNELRPREKEILDLRFGFSDNVPKTLEVIGNFKGVTRERIRQIESKAIRKLKHSSRSRVLRNFY